MAAGDATASPIRQGWDAPSDPRLVVASPRSSSKHSAFRQGRKEAAAGEQILSCISWATTVSRDLPSLQGRLGGREL